MGSRRGGVAGAAEGAAPSVGGRRTGATTPRLGHDIGRARRQRQAGRIARIDAGHARGVRHRHILQRIGGVVLVGQDFVGGGEAHGGVAFLLEGAWSPPRPSRSCM